MNSIPENYIEEKQFDDRINLFFRRFKIYQALQHANAYEYFRKLVTSKILETK